MDEYLVPCGFGEDEFVEKKSRFIGRVWLVETEEEALQKIQEMKKQHYDATHNCWAYVIRDGAVRFSDDGEPGGTAGMPMVQVLQKEGLYNIVCVIVQCHFQAVLFAIFVPHRNCITNGFSQDKWNIHFFCELTNCNNILFFFWSHNAIADNFQIIIGK